MTLCEARQILGIRPDEDPRPLLPSLRATREALAAMVREAPNDTLAMRHQEELIAFDRALAAVRETLEALSLREIPPPARPKATVTHAEEETFEDTTSSPWRAAAIILVLLALGTCGGGWLYWKSQDIRMSRLVATIETLDATGTSHIQNRRWDDARQIFAEIENLLPGSPVVARGRERIETGIAEEQSQFLGYWTGEARAALDSGRWDDAEAAARNVLERFPHQAEAIAVLDGITDAKLSEQRRREIDNLTAMLDDGRIEDAHTAAIALTQTHPGDAEIAELTTRTRTALDRFRADHTRALELAARARARDTGTFDPEALEWLREAALLAPYDETIAKHLEKIASYTRTIRVPEDAADLDEAIAIARENDRILLPAGTWRGTFVANKPLEIQGAGPAETHIECQAIAGCALTIGPDAGGTRITGITFRHIGFDAGADRYSATLVRGGSATFVDCHFVDASGHGLAVIEGGQAEIQRSRFSGNGWNGIAASGPASGVAANESHISGNFGHGAEAWDGASLALTTCRLDGNTGNGAHLDTTATGNRIESCELISNREYGIVLTATGADARITANRVHRNQLGGIAVRLPAAPAILAQNEILSNTGPGIVVEEGVAARLWSENRLQRNADDRIVTRPSLAPAEPE